MRAVGYIRASTELQERSGLGLDAQLRAIAAACEHRGWTLVGVEQDIASGGRRDRPGLGRALAAIDADHADCVVVSRLDRLGRSVAHVASLMERYPGSIVAIDIGLTPDSPAGAFSAHVIAAAAELERALIRERTRDALQAARARGVHLGRPRTMTAEMIDHICALRASGLTLAGIADRLNAEGMQTATGRGAWHAAGIARALRFANG